MNSLTITKAEPTVFVGLDFGTTYSGFAFALASEPEKVHKFYEWPGLAAAGAKNYCKTQTSLLYVENPPSYVLEDWGYEALVKHASRLQAQQHANQIGTRVDVRDSHSGSRPFITRFKLLLAENDPETSGYGADIKLPRGLTPRKAVSDYLCKLSELAMGVLKSNLGSHITLEDVQWCLTVPAIWDEEAKQEMKTCAEIAGMIQGRDSLDQGGSPYPVIIVLEPEAASCYCQKKVKFPLNNGDRFLVVDVGGGTVDLVVHEKIGSAADLKVKEVSPSSGRLRGGTFVDSRFLLFLSRKIKCFPQFYKEQPRSVLRLMGCWETVKHGFDGNRHFAYEFELPAKLARAWETDEKSKNLHSSPEASFDAIDLSLDDMLSIFDPVVNEILQLIEVKMIGGLKVIMIVGGFSASPYLLNKIREAFSPRVEAIIVPNEPGCAISCGAVLFGLNGAEVIRSRISKKTYGIRISEPFLSSDPLHFSISRFGPTQNQRQTFRDGIFDVYVRNGDVVPVNHCVTKKISPSFNDQTESQISLYSSSQLDPAHVDDSGVRLEGSFIVSHPSRKQLGVMPQINVSLYFGRTTVECKAKGANYGTGETFDMPSVTFQKSFEQ